jgi:3-hydroxyisobutyrate dehydrogenase-like beta-hydroxyacid dehydrogenase
MALPVIGIVGFGTFGQFVANRLVQAGYRCGGTEPMHHMCTAWAVQTF